MNESGLTSDRITVEDSIDEVYSLFHERGWTDGLPVVPPTEERVHQMLSATDRQPSEIIGLLAPKMGAATIEKVAINAVMAGCLPVYLPLIIAAVEAVAEEKFGLLGVQTTTHPCGVLLVINGPIVKKLGINNEGNAFGPGVRANATIGRAMG